MGLARRSRSWYLLPDDISVLGFDDMSYCEMMEPRLSSVRVPNDIMGKYAVDLLADQLEHPHDTHVKVEVGTAIIVRDSVKTLKID
jgi:LacI family transcriptional regulator